MGVSTEDLWWIGIILSIFSAFFGSLGDNLVKLSYTKERLAVENGSEPTRLVCRPLWWMGMVSIVVLTTVLTLAAYRFADASLTIPFVGLHICFNLAFARLLNNERFSSKQVGFTFLIFVGVTIVTISGNHKTVTYTSEQMFELMGNTGYIVMTSLLVLVILLLVPTMILHYDESVRCFATSALIGTIAAFTQLAAKMLALCLTEMVNGDPMEVVTNPPFYIAIFTLSVSASSQLYLLNLALSLYNAFVVVPLYNSFLIILGSLYSAVLFEEYLYWDTQSKILMPVGILTATVGVALLSWDKNPNHQDEMVLGSPTDDGDIALMPRSYSFAHTPMLNSELGSTGTLSRAMRGRSYQSGLNQNLHRLEPLSSAPLFHVEGEDEDADDEQDEDDEHRSGQVEDEHSFDHLEPVSGDETLTLH